MSPMPSQRLAAAGRRARVAQGYFTSGAVPYGYERDRYCAGSRRNALIVPNPVYAERVRLIFRLYLRHRSIGRVIAELAERMIAPPRAARWTRQTVAFVLRNQTYIGRVRFGDVNVKGRHEPIVAPIVFWRAGALLRRNDKRRKAAERVAG